MARPDELGRLPAAGASGVSFNPQPGRKPDLGVGQRAGLHRTEYGPDQWDLKCDVCDATWVGREFDVCEWCEKRLGSIGAEIHYLPSVLDPWDDPTPLGDAGDCPTFPIDALPSWIAAHVCQVAHEMQFPVDLPAQLAITALSIACAGRGYVVVRGTWREQLNTYTVTAMPPGAGKSPTFREMLGCFDAWEADLVAAAAPERDKVETRRAILEKERAKHIAAGEMAEALACGDELRELPEIAVPRLMVGDVTPEKLVVMMGEQGGRLALVSTEGGLFGLIAGRYSDKANLDVYLQAWSGDTIRVDRVGRADTVVRNPALTVGLTVQPSVIEGLAETPEFAGRGLLARFMYSLPPDNVGWRDMGRAASIEPVIAKRYETEMVSLADYMRSAPTETVVMMQPAALILFNAWRQEIEERRRPNGDLRPMAEWTTKMESTVARLAGLIALAEGGELDAQVMRRAIRVGRYWEAHARRAHAMWGADPVVVRAGRVIDWVISNGTDRLTLRDIYRHVSRGMTPQDALEVAELLVDNGWARVEDRRPLEIGKRGVPSPVLILHPLSSSFRHSHGRMAVMPLEPNNSDSLSLSEDAGKGMETDGQGHGGQADMTPNPAPVDKPDPEELF